jgi:hypothetical protein
MMNCYLAIAHTFLRATKIAPAGPVSRQSDGRKPNSHPAMGTTEAKQKPAYLQGFLQRRRAVASRHVKSFLSGNEKTGNRGRNCLTA